jgi:ribonuclease BN (tRNA processing enzyme)
MEKFRVRPAEHDTVFLTHLHGDHIAGWPFLLLHGAYMEKRSKPLRLVGPEGSRARLEVLVRGTYPDVLEKAPFPIEYTEIPVRRGSHSAAGIEFDVVPMEHHESSIGYRFRLPGATIAVTGDTRWCPGLEELAAGSDLLVVECSSVEKTEYAHVSVEELGAGNGRLRSRTTAVVHLTDAVDRAIAALSLPGVLAAKDGMIIEMDSADDGWIIDSC